MPISRIFTQEDRPEGGAHTARHVNDPFSPTSNWNLHRQKWKCAGRKGRQWETCIIKSETRVERKLTALPFITAPSSNPIPSSPSFHFRSIMRSQVAPRGAHPHWYQFAGHKRGAEWRRNRLKQISGRMWFDVTVAGRAVRLSVNKRQAVSP